MHSLSIDSIPADICNLCVSMYHNIFDEWDKEISDSGYLTFDMRTGIVKIRQFAGRMTISDVFGSIIVKKGEIQTWKLKAYGSFQTGIIENERCHLQRRKSINDRKNAHGLATVHGYKISSTYDYYSRTGKTYAPPCAKDAKIIMTLDMTGDEYATLSFEINGKDYGIAFDDIPIDKTYRLLVMIRKWNTVQLL